MSSGWLHLLIASVLEITWVIGLKYTNSFTKLMPSVITVVSMVASLYFLALSVKYLPLSTSYPIWASIGIAGSALYGMFMLGESRDIAKIVCIALIIMGTYGLKALAR